MIALLRGVNHDVVAYLDVFECHGCVCLNIPGFAGYGDRLRLPIRALDGDICIADRCDGSHDVLHTIMGMGSDCEDSEGEEQRQ